MKKVLLVCFLLKFLSISAQGQLVVWPGDASNNGVVDMVDVLFMGQGYGTPQGIARGQVGIIWQGYNATEWNSTLPNGLNHVFSDADGSGGIDSVDLLGISSNYGLTHGNINTDSFASGGTIQDFELVIDTTGITIVEGDTLLLPIILNSTSSNGDFYGISFGLLFDSTIVKTGSVNFEHSQNSWIYSQPTDNSLFLEKSSDVRFDLAISRTDQININGGSGVIGFLELIIEEDLWVAGPSPELNLKFIDVNIVNNQLNLRNAIYHDSTVISIQSTVGTTNPSIIPSKIYPNPANDLINIELNNANVYSLELLSIDGKRVQYQSISQDSVSKVSWEIEQNLIGLYFLRLQTDKGVLTRKIIFN